MNNWVKFVLAVAVITLVLSVGVLVAKGVEDHVCLELTRGERGDQGAPLLKGDLQPINDTHFSCCWPETIHNETGFIYTTRCKTFEKLQALS